MLGRRGVRGSAVPRAVVIVGIALAGVLAADWAAAQEPARRDTARSDTMRFDLPGLEVVGRRQSLATSTFLRDALGAQAAGLNALDIVNRSPSFVFTAGDAHGFYEYGQNVQLRVFHLDQLAMTLDGVPLGSQSAAGGSPVGRFVETESVDRVTVNQGSGSIENLSGFGLGGAVVYETMQPDEQAGGFARLTGGNFGTRRAYARYNSGDLGTGARAYLSASQNIFDKWRGTGDQRRLHLEGKLRQDLSNGFVSLNVYYNNRDDHDFLDVTVETFETQGRDVGLTTEYAVLTDKVAQADANALYFDAWSNRRDDLLVSVNVDMQLTPTTALRFTPYFQNQDGVGTWFPDYRPDETAADPLDEANRDQTRNTWRETQYRLNRYGVTASYRRTLPGPANAVVSIGGWTEHSERVQRRVWFDVEDQDRYDRDAITPYWTQFDRDFDTNTYAGYVKGEMTAGPVRLNAGVRAQAYDIAFYDATSSDASELDDAVLFLPQMGFVWDAGAEHELFGSVSRNFSQVPDGALQQAAPVDPERSTNVDLGYRFLRPGRSFGATLFYVDYADKIESIQFGEFDRYANETALQNVGGITSLGAELTADLAVTPALGLFASASFSRSRYKGDIADASEPGGVLRVDGNKAVFTPELQTFGELSWRRGALRVALNGKYIGSRAVSLAGPESGPSAQEELDGYVLVGASARYQWRRFTFEATGTNLTDESYLASSSGIGPGASRRPGGGTYFPGSPRWLTLGVGVDF